jgi:hypothetical protein
VTRATRATRAMARSKVALLFVASQLGVWTGCNAILGNGYGAFDESAVSGNPDGGPEGDALVGGGEGGPGTDGAAMGDGAGGGDGSLPDGTLPDGGTCPRKICPKQLTDADGAQRIALGAGVVYWTTATSVGRVAFDGTGAKTQTVVGGPIVSTLRRGIAVQAGTPYVTVGDRGAAKCTAALSDGCMNTPFIGSAVGAVASSLAVDTMKVYIGVFVDSTPMHGGLWQTDLNGNSPMTYTNSIDQVLDVRFVTPTLYFRTATGIKFVSVITGMPSSAATLANNPVAFDVQGSTLVVATKMNELVVCATSPMVDCATTSLQTRGVPTSAIVVDGTAMIWAEGGTIYRAPLTGGVIPDVLAEGQASPGDLAVDQTTIFWANHGNATGVGGSIMSLPK